MNRKSRSLKRLLHYKPTKQGSFYYNNMLPQQRINLIFGYVKGELSKVSVIDHLTIQHRSFQDALMPYQELRTIREGVNDLQ
jgi:hypothetical protein